VRLFHTSCVKDLGLLRASCILSCYLQSYSLLENFKNIPTVYIDSVFLEKQALNIKLLKDVPNWSCTFVIWKCIGIN